MKIQGPALAKNTALNFIGQVIPALVAVVTIPYIIHGLGVERFGILSLAWVVLGYFSLFDFGLGRATTKFVAEALGRGERQQIPSIVWTSLFLQTILAIIGGIFLSFATPILVERILQIPPHLLIEAKRSFFLLAVSLPIVMYSSSLKGLLEAAQRFDLVNAVRIPSSSLAFLLPAVAVFLGFQLPGTILFLIISMIVTGSAYLLFCFKVFPSLRQPYSPNLTIIRPLFTYGGWITVCSIIIPFLIYSDRFLIGALVSVAAVGYYTAPYEMASRLQIFPWSFATTLFPAFSTMAAFQAKDISLLYARSLKYLLLVMAPITLFIVLFAQVILHLWLGGDFSEKGALVFKILSVGMLFNALSQIPANLIDGMGRPDLRAKIFMLYGVVYLVLAWFLISTMGIVGAAFAWALRGGLELVLFFLASWRLLRFDPAIFIENGLLKGLIAIAFLSGIIPTIITTLGKGVWVQGVVTVICFMLFGVVIWIYVLDQIDKSGLKAMFPHLMENRKTVQ